LVQPALLTQYFVTASLHPATGEHLTNRHPHHQIQLLCLFRHRLNQLMGLLIQAMLANANPNQQPPQEIKFPAVCHETLLIAELSIAAGNQFDECRCQSIAAGFRISTPLLSGYLVKHCSEASRNRSHHTHHILWDPWHRPALSQGFRQHCFFCAGRA
jgi:hypothetical protein